MKLASTGMGPLDVFLSGGLPPGFCTLLVAAPGSGAEIFAKQFAGQDPGERSIIISTEETEGEVRRAMEEAQWRMDHVEVDDVQTQFAAAALEAQRQGGKAVTDVPAAKKRFDPRALVEGTRSQDLLGGNRKKQIGDHDTDYLGRMIEPFTEERPPNRTVIHSIDFFLNLYPEEQVVAALTAVKAANARSGGQLLLVLAKGAHSQQLERRLELLADCLIEMEMERQGTHFERYLMVKKVKNRSSAVGISTYDMGPRGLVLETLERIV